MSIAVRNMEESDVESVHALVISLLDPDLASAPFHQLDVFRATMMSENNFALVCEEDGKIIGTVSITMEQETESSVIGRLTRFFVAPTPSRLEVASTLIATAMQSMEGNLQQTFSELPAGQIWVMSALEQSGFVPSGYLPQKFSGEERASCVIYLHVTEPARNQRRPHPEIIPSARDLASSVFNQMGIIEDYEIREDVVAYPTECHFTFAPIDSDTVATVIQNASSLTTEVFNQLQYIQGRLQITDYNPVFHSCQDADRVIGIIGHLWDSVEKSVSITDLIVFDGSPQGFMVASLIEKLNAELSPEYIEVLLSGQAIRMQKTFDQLGFVPCAYLPCFAMEHGARSDAIKMVKLTQGYETESFDLTSSCINVFGIIDTVFKEQNIGNAVLNLLRDLKIFKGLGEGELRRVARLFSQKLYRPGEVLFEENSQGREIFIIERGEIEIRSKGRVLGSLRAGAVIGEMAFLTGEPRTAQAVSKSATITRIIRREDFDKLLQTEAHMGLIFFQNVALDLAEKLKMSVIQSQVKK